MGQFLVAIDAGHLLRAAELHTFTQQTGTLIVVFFEQHAAVAEVLAAGGQSTRVYGSHVLVELHGDETHDRVLRAVVDLGIALIRVEPRRSSLEDLFRHSRTDEQLETASGLESEPDEPERVA